MSVPLPPTFNYFRSNIDDESSERCPITHIHDIFLDSDERYLIQRVKVAERPHLIYHTEDYYGRPDDDDDGDHEGDGILPIIDGYDIAGWRKEALMVPTDLSSQTLLSPLWLIGASSTMFRRDKQWPVYPRLKYMNQTYLQLRQRLQSTPIYSSPTSNNHQVLIIPYKELCQEVPISGTSRYSTQFAVLVEARNIPAKIIGVAEGWTSMPLYPQGNGEHKQTLTYYDSTNIFKQDVSCCDSCNKGWTFENLLSRFGDIFWRFSDTHGEMMTLSTYAKYICSPEGRFFLFCFMPQFVSSQ